jgi:hypothetical protein
VRSPRFSFGREHRFLEIEIEINIGTPVYGHCSGGGLSVKIEMVMTSQGKNLSKPEGL